MGQLQQRLELLLEEQRQLQEEKKELAKRYAYAESVLQEYTQRTQGIEEVQVSSGCVCLMYVYS
jgi:hypothetical protein